MLKDRILFTLKFFDLQQTPLTLAELRDFLLNEPEVLKTQVNPAYEIAQPIEVPAAVSAEEIDSVVRNELAGQVERKNELFCLTGKGILIDQRIQNQAYYLHREQLIKKFLPGLKLVPFVRGVAVGGSQILGLHKPESDIDLLVVLDPQFLWLGRILVTGYFQLTGHRRHGQKIQNRFCLNHYLAGPIEVAVERDLYNAMEYLRLRPQIYGGQISEFIQNNLVWIRQFFPNAQIPKAHIQRQPGIQVLLEKILTNPLGQWLNHRLGQWQLKRINRGVPAVANRTELSFHSKERKFDLLAKLFQM